MGDKLDQAQELAERHNAMHLANHHSRQTHKMVNTDPYCDGCGDEIPERRRKALPYTRHCVDCQQINEQLSR